MKKILFSLMVLILATSLSACAGPPKTASLDVSDQTLDGNMVMIDSFYLDKAGYVVIHMDKEGAPGPVIGNSSILSGSKRNLKVAVDKDKAGNKVHAMLHYDDGDETYQFPGPDAPVSVEEAVVVKAINLQ